MNEENPQPIENIRSEGYKMFKSSGGGFLLTIGLVWSLIVGGLFLWGMFIYPLELKEGVVESFLIFAFIPLFVMIGIYAKHEIKARKRFWMSVAETNGWSYLEQMDRKLYAASLPLMFKEGYGRKKSNIIVGTKDSLSFHIYEYQFTKQQGKTSITYPYTVFEFYFSGQVPHLYLNYKDDQYSVVVGTTVKLPASLEKNMRLSVPPQYEIEALEIFTPDILEYIQNKNWKLDIEILDQKLYIFQPYLVSTLTEFTVKFDAAHALAAKLVPKLNRARFAPIGDKSPLLKKKIFSL